METKYPNEAYERVPAGLMDVTSPEQDTEFVEHAVEAFDAGTLRLRDGWCIGVDADSPVIPEPDDIVRLYGRGLGSPVRGIAIVTRDGLEVVRYTAPKKFAEEQWDEHLRYEQEHAERMKQPVAVSDGKRTYTNEMRQISGFGGGYEIACREMVLAGLRWLDEHPDADPKFHGYKGIYGIINEDNDDAKALSDAVTFACDGCSGAMHQAACTHVMWIKAHGWDKYVEMMSKHEAAGEQAEEDGT